MSPEKGPPGLPKAVTLATSAGSAAVSLTLNAPLIRVKLLLQAQGEMVRTSRLTSRYRGITDCIVRTYRNEGLLSFWRGNTAACLHSIPSKFLTFGFNEAFRTLIPPEKRNAKSPDLITFFQNVLAGSGAGLMSFVVLYSMDYTRVRLANDIKALKHPSGERQFTGLVDVYRQTLRADGAVGLHRGFVIACFASVWYRGMYFGLYETFSASVHPKDRNILFPFGVGILTSLTAGLLAHPFDTIRVRMMMRSCDPVKYKGSLDCARYIWRNEGVRGFMRGAWLNVLRGVFGAGMLVTYDMVRAQR